MFGQFAIYRARRYRLTRTVWRGVRFWMNGSGWAYAARAALWGLLAMVTLGLILPWREAALERYKMRHSYYGDLQGSFEGRGWEFFKRGWWLWLFVMVSIVLFVILPIAKRVPSLAPLSIIAGIFVPFIPLAAPFIYAVFKAVEWRWWLSGIRFGDVRLESTLSARRADRSLLESDRLGLAAGRCFSPPIVFGCAGHDREHEPDADGQAFRAGQSAGQHSADRG